jgi:hypothetical protein
MERIAIIENDMVVNVVNAPTDWVDPQGRETVLSPIGSGVEIGATRQPDGSWKMPPPPPPTKEEQQSNRAAAYTEEADPLFFKYQRGEATEQEWLDKIEEIRIRYPYPDEA